MKRSTPIFYAKSDYCQEKFPTCVSIDIGPRIRILSGLVLLVCSLRTALFLLRRESSSTVCRQATSGSAQVLIVKLHYY